MTAEAHSWMPASPCGTKCVDAESATVGNGTFAKRVLTVGAAMASFPVVNALTPATMKSGVQRRYAEVLVRCFGITVDVVDQRGSDSPGAMFSAPEQGVLVATGHVGWTDVLVLASVQPISFVARADLVDWPVLGTLARRMRVIPIDRGNLKALPGVIREMADRMAAGERIAFFPEGTTWCGRAYGGLRPALFQSAVDTKTPVQPVRLQYRNDDGSLSTTASFVGEDSMATSLLRMLRADSITAEVVLAPIEQPGADRKDLAARCERAVRGADVLDFEAHGVLESADARNTVKTPDTSRTLVAQTA